MIKRIALLWAATLFCIPPALAVYDDEDENETVAPYQGEDAPRPTPREALPPGMREQAPAIRPPRRAEPEPEQESDRGPVQVYRVVDEDGNVSFSDEPPPGTEAEEITIGPTNTMPAARVSSDGPQLREVDDEEGGGEPVDYQITITSPQAEQTFQNPQQAIGVSYSIQPALADDHSLVLLLDGAQQSGMTAPSNLSRGEHQFKIVVMGRDGQQVAESEPVTIYVHRPSALFTPN